MSKTTLSHEIVMAFTLSKLGYLRCTKIAGPIEELTGFEAGDFLSGTLRFEDIFHPDDKDYSDLIFSNVLPTDPVLLTYRLVQKSGKIKIVRSLHTKQSLLEDGQIQIEIVLQDPLVLREIVVDTMLLANFNAMMETSDDFIYFKDRNHVFTGASQTLVNLTNPAKHWTDLIGKTDYEVFPIEYADIYYTLEKKVFSGVIPIAQEIQPTLDVHGNKGWVDNRKYPIKNSAGTIIGLFGIARNITRLITAEQLAKQAQLSNAILKSIEDGVITCDATGTTTLINRAAREICGFSDLPIRFSEWAQFLKLYKDDSDVLLHPEENPLLRALWGESIRNLAISFQTVRGKRTYAIVNGNPLFDAENQPIGAILSIQDKTDRRLAEKIEQESAFYARSLLEASLDPLVTIDSEGRITDVNQATMDATGVAKEKLIGSEFSSYFTDPERARTGHQEVWTQGALRDFPLAIKRADGKVTEVVYNAALYRNRAGALVGVFAAARDITKQKEYEQQLKKALVIADSANKAKSEFLASMSHEIRTPLNSIVGLVDLLQESKLDEEQRKMLNVASASSENLLCLINDILDLSKVEAGGIVLEQVAFSLKEELEKCLAIVGARAREKDLSLSLVVDDLLPSKVWGDPTRLRQILINLLGNAVKFTERGSITLMAKRAKIGEGLTHILFSVGDQGIGISQDKFDLIFERFAQGDSSITRRFGGSGLGLPIAKKLVELMGGRFWLTSKVGEGSIFYFTASLPAVSSITEVTGNQRGISNNLESPKESLIPKNCSEASNPGTVKKIKPLHILFAEDMKDNRFLVEVFLLGRPYTMVTVENGREALEKFKQEKFDLVLMDVQMPLMDGYTATREIRKFEYEVGQNSTPIFAMTAHAFDEDVQASIMAGCNEHITKPIKKGQLLEKIDEYC